MVWAHLGSILTEQPETLVYIDIGHGTAALEQRAPEQFAGPDRTRPYLYLLYAARRQLASGIDAFGQSRMIF
jgi:hypothetical protein